MDAPLPCPVFEGSEKRIEIDFNLDTSDVAQQGLRKLTREQLDSFLDLAACTIVSERSNAHFDAYVLSESSLFVYPRKCVLKTCGTTKLLAAVPRILELAAKQGQEPLRVKYSRASYLFPDQQPSDHKFFCDEAAFLDTQFGHMGLQGGRAHILGDPLKGLQWHVYTAGADVPPHRATQTLEVCMTGLCPVKASQFFRGDHFVNEEETTRVTGIRGLVPYADLDAVMFEPCGYSLNGLEGPGFLTIHVTPEEACSYASVELCGFNVGIYSPAEVVDRIAAIFEPKSMSVFVSTDAEVCVETWDSELFVPPRFAEISDRSKVSLHIGGHLSVITSQNTRSRKTSSSGGNSPRGPLQHSFSFASSLASINSYEQVAAPSSCDICERGNASLSDSPPSTPDLEDKGGLVRSLTGMAGGSLELAAVLASHGAVITKDHSMASVRAQASALISALDPDSLDFFYLYDLGIVTRLHSAWSKALPRVHPHYAVKCNSDPGLIATLAALGAGFDCASRSELDLVLGLGVSADRIVYANCCKLPREMRYAAKRGVEVSVVDGRSELEKTKSMTPNASLLLRIRADDPNARCQLGNKYGCEEEDVDGLLAYAVELGLRIVGVSFHVGSGAECPDAFDQAITQAREVFDKGEALGFSMGILDIGGGMMSVLHDDGSVTFKGDVSAAINSALDRHFPPSSGISIIAEPGRFFAESTATMACSVFGYRERKASAGASAGWDYYITDGLYGSFNSILYDHAHPTCEPLRSPLLPPMPEEAPRDTWLASTVFGPTCDGLDTVLKDTCQLPVLRNGDWLLFPNMGAYTIAGATNFNGINVTHIPTFYVYSA